MSTKLQAHEGTTIRMVREIAGLSIGKVAQLAGCSASHLGQIERGERRLSEDLGERLRRVLVTALSEGTAAA
jgi:transcriptional regulator with XRE-family HTH domain